MNPNQGEDSSNNFRASNMSLVQHIAELRYRIIRCALAVFVGLLICWGFSEYIFDIMRAPIAQYLPDGGLVFTGPLDKFLAHIKLSFICGTIISAPYWLYQVWQFIAPALYKNEKKYVGGFIVAGTFQFVLGIMFCYFIVFPMAFKFLMTFGGTVDKPMITINQYLGFFTHTAILFGLTFEMPVIITFLGVVGVVNKAFLKKYRRYAIVGMSVISAIAAPPDALSMILLLVPLWLMYDISVWLVGILGKKDGTLFEVSEDDPETTK